jgi:hypothetical protein
MSSRVSNKQHREERRRRTSHWPPTEPLVIPVVQKPFGSEEESGSNVRSAELIEKARPPIESETSDVVLQGMSHEDVVLE